MPLSTPRWPPARLHRSRSAPAGWIRARLTEWFGPDATPPSSRSQQLAAERAQILADQAARRARDAARRPGPRPIRRRRTGPGNADAADAAGVSRPRTPLPHDRGHARLMAELRAQAADGIHAGEDDRG